MATRRTVLPLPERGAGSNPAGNHGLAENISDGNPVGILPRCPAYAVLANSAR